VCSICSRIIREPTKYLQADSPGHNHGIAASIGIRAEYGVSSCHMQTRTNWQRGRYSFRTNRSNRYRYRYGSWWRRRESNPRPQWECQDFYERSVRLVGRAAHAHPGLLGLLTLRFPQNARWSHVRPGSRSALCLVPPDRQDEADMATLW
jgi:hypothetical protein